MSEGPKDCIVPAMERIDPFLRFLTKATGNTMVPLQMLQKVLPKSANDDDAGSNSAASTAETKSETTEEGQHEILLELTERGVIHYDVNEQTVGFPRPPSSDNASDADSPRASSALLKPPSKFIGKGLHGSSEAVAKRRMKVLLWTLEKESRWICRMNNSSLINDVDKMDSADETNYSTWMKKRGDAKKRKVERRTNLAGQNRDESNLVSHQGLKSEQKEPCHTNKDHDKDPNNKEYEDKTIQTEENNDEDDDSMNGTTDRAEAFRALHNLFSRQNNHSGIKCDNTHSAEANQNAVGIASKEELSKRQWLPRQAAWAGSLPGRSSRYGSLSERTLEMIPTDLLRLFNLDDNELDDNYGTKSDTIDYLQSKNRRKLYLHQAQAIDATINGIHTVVCTSTGSGKSMCFLLPVMAKAMSSLQHNDDVGSASILIFPTKALAQDQLTKINTMLKSLPFQPDETKQIRAGVIDGDTPHSQRDSIASKCQIILTNPDTLHAAILPNWKRPAYKRLLERVTTVVIDEAHVYEGTFGAHVALVLARLRRICRVASSGFACSSPSAPLPLFIACSATMNYPEEHFRVLCPINEQEPVCVLASAEDGSPCTPKHFFVWNPPILDINGNSTGSVFMPKKAKKKEDTELVDASEATYRNAPYACKKRKSNTNNDFGVSDFTDEQISLFTRRRHSADETALLLARAVSRGIRCIAFCKTRCLVEWVYERAQTHLKSSENTSHLASRIESYRGGYSAEARRSIEERFFRGDLWGVVGTNALELGVDVGKIDLTLHCGYPGSRNSLLQQAGRSGRGTGLPSCSILVAFSAPSEQFLWKIPKNILHTGINVVPSLPVCDNVLQGHLLCAGEEFPLTGDRPVSSVLNEMVNDKYCPADEHIFGCHKSYNEEIDRLIDKGLLRDKRVCAVKGNKAVQEILCKETHPVLKPAWKRVNLRSIEPLNYLVVDVNHPFQDGKTDKLVDKAAVLDSIPYSRVFYHAFPGAIITHRGTRYKIISMESPPPFLGGNSIGRSKSADLCCYATPVQVNYSTQALSINEITVVKQTDGVELHFSENAEFDEKKTRLIKLAGRGTVNVKRSVHGYKKLSLVHRKEISRTSIVLPSMEFDTNGFWIDADASNLKDVVHGFDAGVHALSHALVAVAPIFTPCSSSDIHCDHSRFQCTRILLYDAKAGGSGITHALYDQLLDMLQVALDLLHDCSSCSVEAKYDGGCPGCLQSVPCDNFQEDLSRSAALTIGRHLLDSLKRSKSCCSSPIYVAAKRDVMKSREVLIGRPSWLENVENSKFADVDE